MKLPLSLIAIIISGSLFAQTTQRTIENQNTKEIFYVSMAHKAIKEGSYTLYTLYGNRMICDGFYKKNLKDSLWRYFSPSMKLAGMGYYKNGEKTGVWDTYSADGELQVKYDFTNKKLLIYNRSKQDSIKQYYVINGSDTVKTFLGRPPIFLDDEERFLRQMTVGMRYPIDAKEHNIQGKVIIGFTIDLNGKILNYRIKKALGYGCDEEALKAVRNGFNGDWLPGLLNGNPVVVEYEVPISFSLQTQ